MISPAVDALLDAYADRGRALQRLLWVIAHHPNELAADPDLAVAALDSHPKAVGLCPPGCTGDCTPDPAVWARYNALRARSSTT
ncbi:hypothetical protein [Streptomyces sp. NPDC047070]|uniref:hypothetical protein n=1 Tax=Streptomyces sp. NPDC047070 TaxID=3154923 RepID=UPI003452169A